MGQFCNLGQGMKKRSQSIEKTTETRRKIIVSALAEFNQLGFAKSKIASIAANAGLGKGTIYSYFETKESLFEGVVDYLIQETYHPIQSSELAEDQKVQDFILEQMLPGIDNIEEAGRADIARLMLREGKAFNDILEMYTQKIYQPGLNELTKLIEMAKKRNELKSDVSAEVLASLVIAPIWMGMIHNGLLMPMQPLDIRKMFCSNVKFIFHS